MPHQIEIMGIVNVTPDSFSDGGRFNSREAAIKHALLLEKEGASILDIGGESTRPGADTISIDEELERVIPVIEGLSKETSACISIDTRRAAVMTEALKAGASMINDVTALEGEGSLLVAANSDARVVLMHKKGEPAYMQDNPTYEDVVEEVYSYLKDRKDTAINAGVEEGRIILDVGIGFGKTVEQNLRLLNNFSHFTTLHSPLLLGASRKSFIGALSGEEDAQKRLGGSLAAVGAGVSAGARIVRVHDVQETAQYLEIMHAITSVQTTQET